MIKIRTFESAECLMAETEQRLRDTLAKPGNLMLSGGSTPYVVYNRIASNPCPVHPDRKIFLSDERMQPMDSDRNNAHNLMPMLQALRCEDRFIRIETSLPASVKARWTTYPIFLRCSRLASSGTTPPKLRCVSTCDATTLDSTVCPSSTSAAAVSSHEDSIPSISMVQ